MARARDACWDETAGLVIDEMSMASVQLFTYLSHIAQALQDNDAPWGGIRLIVCGHFHQLKPVEKGATWACQAPKWAECQLENCRLSNVFRQ